MRLTGPVGRRPHPLVLAIIATVAAAALVFYLQHRAITTLESQTRVIVRQLSEQAAEDVAAEMRRTLDGPIFDTLAAVNHPDLRAWRLDLIAQNFSEGLRSYPHVEQFLAWRAEPDPASAGDVMFYGRSGAFAPDAILGREVIALAQQHSPSQQIYIAAESGGPSPRHLFLRLFWTDAQRLEYFAVLGFVVDPVDLPDQLFADRPGPGFDEILSRRGGTLPLQLRVTDEFGVVVHGDLPSEVQGARIGFPMLFYPEHDIRSRLAAGVAPRPWVVEVGTPRFASAGAAQGYWPVVVSVMLMLVAVGLIVQTHRRSSELARMQADFVSHVSHQLKTPLSLLIAATETLQMDRIRSPEKLASYLDTIRAEAQRLSALVQRVLEFSRLQQPRRYEFERVDLGALVRETVEAFEHGLSSRQVTFHVQQSGSGPHVLADPAALEQVVANLLDNAVKYSGACQPVTVTVGSDGRTATVAVADRGEGIARAEQARIFERFYRGQGASHRPGFGLGLPIVRELMQAHKGQVEVASVPGTGSTFRVTLPCLSEPTDAGELSAQPREEVPQ
jgi:signal transduction histidine kinase